MKRKHKMMDELPVCEVCPGKNADKKDEMVFGPNDECKCTAKFGTAACSQWLYGWFCGTYGEEGGVEYYG